MQKLTKSQFKAALKKNPLNCTENELRFIFNLLGFDLKEFRLETARVTFEIHFTRHYIMKAEIMHGLLVFSNQWIVFDDNDDPQHIKINFNRTLLDFITLFFNMFGRDLLEPIHYTASYTEGWSMVDSKEEGREYWEILCELGRAERTKPETPKSKLLN